ncbi:MAG: anti-sigma factor antagonist [Clostridia bacterium]|nr:anti-sigma factor antagonist [Clostridia bacterium]
MAVEISARGEVLTAVLIGEIDHHSAFYIRKEIDSAIELNMPSLLILDFERVTFMDSSGIGLVMGRYKTIAKRCGEVHVVGAKPQIYKVMKLSGLERLVRLEKCS